MHRHWFALWLALMVAAISSPAATVSTLDGRSLEGGVLLTNGLIEMKATDGSVTAVAASNLLSVVFSSNEGSPDAGPASGQGLLGYYFGNTNLNGPVYVRLDETVDFDWSIGEPAPGVPIDYFGVAWCGEVEAPASGDYSFAVAADEFVELFLDNQSILNTRARRDGVEVFSVPVRLQRGSRHALRLEYFDLTGTARVKLMWSGPGLSRSIVPRGRLHPRGFPPAHTAQVSTNRGLLGTYYKSLEFAGPTLTRVDPRIDFNWTEREPLPGIHRTNFAIRWTGQVQADHSEEYTFYVVADDRVRLWIDDKLVINRVEQLWLAETAGSLPLIAGEKHDVRLELWNTSGDAVARLLWSSASTPKTNVPASHLFPSRPAPASLLSVNGGDRLPPGLLLRNGSFVAGTVEHATESSLRASGRLQGRPLSTVNIARILCQPVPRALESRISPGRAGLLLAGGDFLDGNFRGIEDGRVKLDSVLFGSRSFDLKKDVLVVVLRDAARSTGAFEIQLRDASRLLAGAGFEAGRLVAQDSILGVLRLSTAEVLSVRRLTPGIPARL